MCFENDVHQLNSLRKREHPIILWKNAPIDRKTGLARTYSDGVSDEVWWKKGKSVKPHKIRKPLKQGQICTAGLYFYTREADARGYGTLRAVIKASVQPKHIIAVNYDGTCVLAIQAKVLEAPNPDQNEIKAKWLKEKLKIAYKKIEAEEQNMKSWLQRKEDAIEAKDQIRDELKAVLPTKKRREKK